MEKIKPSIGVSHKIKNILINLYTKANIVIKSKEGISDPVSDGIPFTIGVLQGETLSPLLFLLFLNDTLLNRDLKGVSVNHLVEIVMLAFADDMIFLSKSSRELRKIIKGLEEYFHKNELLLNIKKTKTLLIQKGGYGSEKKLPPLLYNDEKIDFEKHYTYLGVPISRTGLFDKKR